MITRRATVCAATANFLSSCAGGAILTDCISASLSAHGADAIFTYIVGSALSWLLLRVSRKWIRTVFPFLGLIAAGLFLQIARSGGTPNLFLLTLLFMAIFIPRFLRTEIVGELSADLPVVEFAYSAGYLLAFLNPTLAIHFGLYRLSLFGVGVMCSVALCDLLLIQVSTSEHTECPELKDGSFDVVFRALSYEVVLLCGLTIGCQLVLQSLASQFRTTRPLLGFELGVTAAPLFYSFAKTKWENLSLSKLPLAALLLSWMTIVLCERQFDSFLVAASACLASLLYEFIAIDLLQRLGKRTGSIGLALGLNGVSASICYWVSNLLAVWASPYRLLWVAGLISIPLASRTRTSPFRNSARLEGRA